MGVVWLAWATDKSSRNWNNSDHPAFCAISQRLAGKNAWGAEARADGQSQALSGQVRTHAAFELNGGKAIIAQGHLISILAKAAGDLVLEGRDFGNLSLDHSVCRLKAEAIGHRGKSAARHHLFQHGAIKTLRARLFSGDVALRIRLRPLQQAIKLFAVLILCDRLASHFGNRIRTAAGEDIIDPPDPE